MAPASSRRSRRLLAFGLFLFAPFVGEFLLGNTPITSAPAGLLMAPMYGGDAVLVREIGRRFGGWPTMLPLAAAYALLEEGPIDQMLFNPEYLQLDSFAGFAPIPGLGISATLTVSSLVMHTIWSICVPIAIIEAFDRSAGDEPRPWLRPFGLTVVTLIFVLGSFGLAVMQSMQFQFLGTPPQFASTGIAIAALIAVGLLLGRHRQRVSLSGTAPSSAHVGLTAFLLTSLYWIIDIADSWFGGAWIVIAVKAVLVAVSTSALWRWSRRLGPTLAVRRCRRSPVHLHLGRLRPRRVNGRRHRQHAVGRDRVRCDRGTRATARQPCQLRGLRPRRWKARLSWRYGSRRLASSLTPQRMVRLAHV